MGVMTWCRTRFGRPSSLATLLCVGVMAAPLSFAAPAYSRAPDHTIGLVLTSWIHALYETPGAKEECPAGWGTGENAEMAARPDVVGAEAEIRPYRSARPERRDRSDLAYAG